MTVLEEELRQIRSEIARLEQERSRLTGKLTQAENRVRDEMQLLWEPGALAHQFHLERSDSRAIGYYRHLHGTMSVAVEFVVAGSREAESCRVRLRQNRQVCLVALVPVGSRPCAAVWADIQQAAVELVESFRRQKIDALNEVEAGLRSVKDWQPPAVECAVPVRDVAIVEAATGHVVARASSMEEAQRLREELLATKGVEDEG